MTKFSGRIPYFWAWRFVAFKNYSVRTCLKLFLILKNGIGLIYSWCCYFCNFRFHTFHFHLTSWSLAFVWLTWLEWFYATDIWKVFIFFLWEILKFDSNFLHSYRTRNRHLFWLIKLHGDFSTRLENGYAISDIYATTKGRLPWNCINHLNSDHWNYSLNALQVKLFVGKLFL